MKKVSSASRKEGILREEWMGREVAGRAGLDFGRTDSVRSHRMAT